MDTLQLLTLRLAYQYGILEYDQFKEIFCVRPTPEKQVSDHRFALQSNRIEEAQQ